MYCFESSLRVYCTVHKVVRKKCVLVSHLKKCRNQEIDDKIHQKYRLEFYI